eukprot:7767610-Karenia_brevis.AAC.1
MFTTKARKVVQVRRTQFSVSPASARIVYNAQGEGFNATVVDLARPPSMSAEVHWLACYVMLSRARSLEGLLILRLASRSELSAGAPSYLVDAVERLLQLERESMCKVRDHLAKFSNVLPLDILQLFDASAADEQQSAYDQVTSDRAACVAVASCARAGDAKSKADVVIGRRSIVQHSTTC